MTTTLATFLILHVLFGLIGVICSYVVTYLLLKEQPKIKTLLIVSKAAFISYVISWYVGGEYYVDYYGGKVKPAIINGAYPWAHSIFMEAKEHVFLFLPFATLALAMVICASREKLHTDPILKKQTMLLSLTITVLATIVTLSGVFITGGAR